MGGAGVSLGDPMSPLLRDLLNTMSIPYTAAPPRIPVELDGVSLGQLMTALRFSGLVISNRDGVLVIHQQETNQ